MDEELQGGEGAELDLAGAFGDEGEGSPDDGGQEQDLGSLIPEDEGAQAQQQQQDDDPEDEWEAGGEKYKLKRSELRAGYMKDADYRQKTAKVAERERAAEQFAQRLNMERQQSANQLEVLMGTLQQSLVGSQPSTELLNSDPTEYLRQQAAHNERVQQFNQAYQHRQLLQQQMQAAQYAQFEQRVRQEQSALLERIPEWRSEKTRAAEQKGIAEMLSQVGYQPDEINSLNDSRAVALARDAWKWRQQQQLRTERQEPPRVPKPIRPGTANAQKQTNSLVSRANERLRRNPNDSDALAGLLAGSGL